MNFIKTILNRDFLIEVINRFKTRSPKFFFIMQVGAALLFAVSWIPKGLEELRVTPAHWLLVICDWARQYSIGFFVASSMTSQSKPVAVGEHGEIIKKTNQEKLPFTSQVEKQEAEKTMNEK